MHKLLTTSLLVCVLDICSFSQWANAQDAIYPSGEENNANQDRSVSAPLFPPPTFKLGYKVYHNLDHDGVYIVRSIKDQDCKVEVIYDIPIFIKNIEELKNANMINDIEDNKEFIKRKNYLMQNFSEHFSPLIVKMIFSEIKPEICSFSFSYISKDPNGKESSPIFLSYVFFKSVFDQINWGKFSYYDIPSVVSLYYIPEWFSRAVISEEQGFWK